MSVAPLVKICGVTHPEDAKLAASLGADFIGIIFHSASKRHVSIEQAKDIAAATIEAQVTPVGVFVEQSSSEIRKFAETIGLTHVQLHGARAKDGLHALLPLFRIIYSFAVDGSNVASVSDLPPSVIPLFDTPSPGSGKSFNWATFCPPNRPWALAGGINPDNVEAARQLHPTIIDVCSGVEKPGTNRKDKERLKTVIDIAKMRVDL